MLATPLLHALPAELIQRIYDFLDPSSHYDFALTSKRIAHYSRDVLAHHGECHRHYFSCTLGSRQSTTALLRTLLQDRVAAYYVKNIDFDDYEGSEHVSSDGPDGASYSTTNACSLERGNNFPSTNSDPALGRIVEQMMDTADPRLASVLSFKTQYLETHLQKGSTNAQRALILGLCPRLRSLRILQFPHAALDEHRHIVARNSSAM